MKILLTGAISPIVFGTVERLKRNAHQVTVMSRTEISKPVHASVITGNVHYSNLNADRLIRPGCFQAVIFFYSYQCEESQDRSQELGSILDEMCRTLRLSKKNGVERFVLVTDQRVFGSYQQAGDSEAPAPDTPAGIFIKAAEDILSSECSGDIRTIIVRVTHLYLPGYEDSFFGNVVRCSKEHKLMVIDGTEDTFCDFLHIDDLAQFITLYLDSDMQGIVHLAYGDTCTYSQVINTLQAYLPSLSVLYTGRQVRSESWVTSKSIIQMDWVPRHNWEQEVSLIISGIEGLTPKQNRFKSLLDFRCRVFGKALPWVELILFGWLSQWLTSMSSIHATFRVADFWLFYPVLMGSLHGGLIGNSAALIACIFYGFDWVRQGNDLYLLLYNIDNWLPLMVYMLAGGLFGYMHDREKTEKKMLEREMEERDRQISSIESMYLQASEDRSQLQKQVMRSRDSYGRIYAITRKLDTMQPEQILLSTLNVVEDIMQNRSVSIYSRLGDSKYARLIVHSRGYEGKLTKSLNIADYALMKERIDRKETFINTSLEPGYPALCAPIIQNDRSIAMIALWDMPFEQQTLYHQNLFNIVAGLVQSAMVRTLRYFELSHEMYLDHTHILSKNAFRSAQLVYLQMRKQGISSYLLLQVKKNPHNLPLIEMDRLFGLVIRASDLVGQSENGNYLVLLPQASKHDLPLIENRFRQVGLVCEVDTEENDHV